jgi:hypothetical protein
MIDGMSMTVNDPFASAGDHLPEALRGGSADAFAVSIGEVTMRDGSSVNLPSPGVTAVVGANNVGKSTFLRELVNALSARGVQPPPQIVASLGLRKAGSSSDLIAWLAKHSNYVSTATGAGFVRMGSQQPLAPVALAEYWQRAGPNGRSLTHLAGFLVHYADVMQRISFAGGVGQRGDIAEPPTNPLHYLQDDPALLEEVTGLSRQIFRKDLTLDRLSGNLQLRVGKTGVTAPSVEAVTREYRDALVELPLLATQGDGMRSLLGLLLPVVTATYPIIVVDEPEAFLHPPQAAALGRELARLARNRGLQVVTATHDRNFLSGLLESEVDVSVIRLSRQDDTTTAHQLEADSLRRVWNDPVLRYGNVLDGLFHRLVVLAEADPDCRYYAAALDAANDTEPLAIPPSEVLFVPCGGKDGMPKVARALNAVRVPVVASPDLDILDDEGKLRALVETFGGEWSTFAADYRLATEPFRANRSAVLASHVRRAVDSVLEQHGDSPYTYEVRAEVMANLRLSESPWKALKVYGQLAFKGQQAEAAERLLASLDDIGVVALRVGELENLAPAIGVGKGPAWLPKALEREAHKNEETQRHVAKLVARPIL